MSLKQRLSTIQIILARWVVMCKMQELGHRLNLARPAMVQAYFVCKGGVFAGWPVTVLLARRQLLPGGLALLWHSNRRTFSFEWKTDHSSKSVSLTSQHVMIPSNLCKVLLFI